MRSFTHSGFSLPEVMVTIAVLLILSTTAVPSMAAFIDQQRAQAYIRQFSMHLAYARVAATSSNLPVRVCPSSSGQCENAWQQYPIQLAVLNPATEQSELLRELPPPASRHTLRYNREAITFRRDGSLNGFENGTFFYCGKPGADWHYKVVLNQAGRNKVNLVNQPCPYI